VRIARLAGTRTYGRSLELRQPAGDADKTKAAQQQRNVRVVRVPGTSGGDDDDSGRQNHYSPVLKGHLEERILDRRNDPRKTRVPCPALDEWTNSVRSSRPGSGTRRHWRERSQLRQRRAMQRAQRVSPDAL
jgi:hypothetical protein